MIILNGKKFAKNDREFTDSLFHRDGTCVGYYKVTQKAVYLMDMHKNRIGVIPKAEDVLGACKQSPSGKYWYSYGDIKEIGKFNSYRQEIQNIRQVKREVYQ